MNWFVVAAVIFVAFLQLQSLGNPEAHGIINSFVLDGWNPRGLFGHMWLHGGLIHLIGNLIFLWIFGNAVCSKIGNVLYLPVYIGLGLIAASSHLIFGGGRAIGASGAINGIVGMYLVFFPQNSMSCFFLLFFRPICFSVSGYWMILLWFGFDLFGAFSGSGHVAYLAHIGGFLGGFGLAILMLKNKWIVMERYEKSILDIFRPKKKPTMGIPKEEMEFWKREIKKTDSKKAKTVTSTIKPKMTKGAFIHFNCSCGQRIQVSREYAGKTGRCPKCSTRIKIPEE
jgi:membrane associated rhomboid family serine protease